MTRRSRTSDQPSTFHRPFTLSITRALGDQLAAALDTLTPAALDLEHLHQVEKRAGVYQLYLRDEFVYVGKADKDLRGRLTQHYKKLRGRQNVPMAEVGFSCLYVNEDFSALAPERLLIDHYRAQGGVPWNTNGFGSKDPGKNRDQTRIEMDHFDYLFPINLDLGLSGLPDGEMPLGKFMAAVKKELPFLFRYANGGSAISEPVQSQPEMTAHDAFTLIARALPDPWQVVALPGYVVAYPNQPSEYQSSTRVYSRGGNWDDFSPIPSPEHASYDEPGLADEDAQGED